MISIDNATFLVRDLDKAITFFVDAIGFALRQDETFEDGGGASWWARRKEEPGWCWHWRLPIVTL